MTEDQNVIGVYKNAENNGWWTARIGPEGKALLFSSATPTKAIAGLAKFMVRREYVLDLGYSPSN